MSNSLKTKPTDDQDTSPIDKAYKKKLSDLTDPKHHSKDGVSSSLNNPVDLNHKEKEAANDTPSLYRPTAKKGMTGVVNSMKNASTRKKTLFGGGSVATIIVMLVIFIFPIVTGPFQFIHLSQILQQDYDEIAAMSDQRTSSFMRKFKWGGKNPYIGSRLGTIGNRIATNIETKLNTKGVELITTPTTGVLTGVKVDGKIVAEFDGADSNKFRRDVSKTKISEAMGWSKTTTAIMTRLPFKRYDIDLRPLGNVKRKVDESVEKYQERLRQEKESRTSDKSFDYSSTRERIQELEEKQARGDITDAETDELKVLKENSDLVGAAADARETYDTTEGDHNTKLKAAAEKFEKASSKAGGLSMVATLLALSCLVDSLSDTSKTQAFEGILLPSSRMGADSISEGDQIASGINISTEELAVRSESLYDPVTDTSWADSESFGGSVPVPDEYKLATQGISTAASIINGAEKAADLSFGIGLLTENRTVCNTVTNPLVGWGLFAAEVVVGLLSLGISEGVLVSAGQGFKLVVKELVQDYATGKVIGTGTNWMMSAIIGKVVPALARGALYGSIVSVGSHYASNEAARSVGGTSLSPDQTAALDSYLRERRIENLNSKGLAYKYLSLNNYYSVSSKITRNVSKINVKGLINGFASILSSPLKSLGSIFSEKAIAQTPVDYVSQYGSEKIGFSLDVMFSDDPILEDPFAAEEYVRINKLESLYEPCFKSPVESYQEGNFDELKDFYKSPMPNIKGCSYPKTEQEKYDFTVYSVARFDLLNLLSLGCGPGEDETSCSEIGLNDNNTSTLASGASTSTIVGDPYTSSVDIPCSSGTRDLGVHDGYVKSQLIKIRLCALTGFDATKGSENESMSWSRYYIENSNGEGIVNSRVSGAWYALIQAAKREGLILSATQTFRTMEHQQSFWDANPNPRIVAPPGTSSHQAGVAIDFYGTNVKDGSAQNCSNRVTDESSAVWKWLEQNAYKFGFKQYSAESWHWDALNKSNRCSNQTASA